jgi:histidinol phosphatase-like enzyme (inositol monophosphatase family)
MTHDRYLLEELREFAEWLAKEAGSIALSHAGAEIARERKLDGSIVTIADREAEQRLRQLIAHRYPDDAILGEEFGATPGRSGRRWIVDPIDGTFSYAHGVPLFGTLIGVEIDGDPAVGVIHMPALGETMSAATTLGASLNGVRARVSSVQALGDALVLCGDFLGAKTQDKARVTQAIAAQAGARRGWGDCSAYLLVASGRAEVALDHVMSIWDCAALLPIVEEAGGRFTDWRGRRTIDGGDAIASNAALHEQIMKLVDSTA